MKLYIKQKIFSWTEKFTVTDEYGEIRYTVEGELLSLWKKLHIYDAAGEEAALIRRKIVSFLPTYHVFCGEEQIAEIRKELAWLRPKYSLARLGWEIRGHISAHDYEITCDGCLIATIRKKWFSLSDSYELDVEDPGDELPALAVVLTIDCVMAEQDNDVYHNTD